MVLFLSSCASASCFSQSACDLARALPKLKQTKKRTHTNNLFSKLSYLFSTSRRFRIILQNRQICKTKKKRTVTFPFLAYFFSHSNTKNCYFWSSFFGENFFYEKENVFFPAMKNSRRVDWCFKTSPG